MPSSSPGQPIFIQVKLKRSSESAKRFPVPKNKGAYLDQLVIFEPGNVRFGVAEGNTGQHCFGLYQKGHVGGMALDLRLWWTDGHHKFSLNGTWLRGVAQKADVLIFSCSAPQLLAGSPMPFEAMQQYSPLSESLA